MIEIDSDLDLEAIANAVRSCPSISAISTPTSDAELGPVAISYDNASIDISVIAVYGFRLSTVVEQVESAIRILIGPRRLTVTVDDLDIREAADPD